MWHDPTTAKRQFASKKVKLLTKSLKYRVFRRKTAFHGI